MRNFEASGLQVQHSNYSATLPPLTLGFLDKKSGSYGQVHNDNKKKVDLSNYRLYVSLCLIMTQSGKINSYLCAKMGNRLIYFLVKDPYILSPPSI